MEFIANLVESGVDPGRWARAREAEGWHGVAVADHVSDRGRTYPHVWVAATAMAAATERVLVTTAFANGLLRSPVDAAHAALALQQVAGGRFELGLGAGWSRAEIEASGLRFPPPGERVERYEEAIRIVRALLHDGSCRFQGRHFDVDLGPLGPPVDQPPALVASLGGPRSIAAIAPLVDRVEAKLTASVTRTGAVDYGAFATIDEDHVRSLVDRIRSVAPEVPISTFVQFGCGPSERVERMVRDLGDSLMGQFVGSAGRVADAVHRLERFGFDRVLLTPYTDDSLERIAPDLLAG